MRRPWSTRSVVLKKQGGEVGDPFSVEDLRARASNGRVIVDDESRRAQRSP